MKYAFINKYKSRYSVRALCIYLKVARSGYYHWCKNPISLREQADSKLTDTIKALHVKTHEAYGTLRIWQALKQQGIVCGRDRVARLRRDAGSEI